MKIGTSYSRCVRDIIDGKVDIKDVVVIVSRTDFDPNNDTHWKNIWEGYIYGGMSYAEWANYSDREEDFKRVTLDLYESGKLHQPRQYGAHPPRMAEYWYDLILSNEVVENNPAAKKAWENYKLISGLS
jgi:hypothetical protein